MSKSFYEKLREENGSKVVWYAPKHGVRQYHFTIGDSLMDKDDMGEEFELAVEDNPNIEVFIGMGDDCMNCIAVNDLDKLSEYEMNFIEEWVGSNCYTDW